MCYYQLQGGPARLLRFQQVLQQRGQLPEQDQLPPAGAAAQHMQKATAASKGNRSKGAQQREQQPADVAPAAAGKRMSKAKKGQQQEAVPLQTAPHPALASPLAAARLLGITSFAPADIPDMMQRALDHLVSTGQLQLPGSREGEAESPAAGRKRRRPLAGAAAKASAAKQQKAVADAAEQQEDEEMRRQHVEWFKQYQQEKQQVDSGQGGAEGAGDMREPVGDVDGSDYEYDEQVQSGDDD
jgi:hypothetical protein